jgi:glycosyltransferase involved in cell wall biosynthesis
VIERIKQAVLDRLGITRLAGADDRLGSEVNDLRNELTESATLSSDTTERFEDRLTNLEVAQRISATTAWAATAPLRHEPLLSVVMATRDRGEHVGTAIESVIAQTYAKWQLVVVDDGSDDSTSEVLARSAAADTRIHLASSDAVGAAAARNVGLDTARGTWITFIDDDNTMAPGWLRAVVEYTGRMSECDSLYGVGLREDHVGEAGVPRVLFAPTVDIEQLRFDNSIDLGTLAVRAGHPELKFDESLERYIDWEMVVRLAEHGSMHPVPVIASAYSTRADNRISDAEDDPRLASMQQRLGGIESTSDGPE